MAKTSEPCGLKLTVGEADGYVILSVPGWPDAYIDPKVACEIIDHMRHALHEIERRERDGIHESTG